MKLTFGSASCQRASWETKMCALVNVKYNLKESGFADMYWKERNQDWVQ
jgi:hypothetical protein